MMIAQNSRGFIFALIVLTLLVCNGNQVFAEGAIVNDAAELGMDSELTAHTNEDLLAGSGPTTEDIWGSKALHMLPAPPDSMVWEAINVDYWVRVDLSDPDDLQAALVIGLKDAEQGVYEYLLHGGMLEKLLEAGIEAEIVEGVTRFILRRDPLTLPDRADETMVGGGVGILDTGSCLETTGSVNSPIPDQGYFEDSLDITCAPAGSYITNVEYRLRIDDTGDPLTFYCGDYEIYLGSASTPNFLVYDNLGGRTDGGFDDDAEDDSDIYLNWRSTAAFNGEPANQALRVRVEDVYASDTGLINYFEFTIYWEIPLPEISFSPSSLTPSCPQGQNAASQTFEVWNSGTGTLSYSITEDAPWISSISPSSGTSTGERDTITVDYDTSGLAPGIYAATVIVASPEAVNSPQHISLALEVIPVPTISTYPSAFTNSCNQGTDAVMQGLAVWNSGSGTLLYTVSDDASWLSCGPTIGTSTGEADSITVYYETAALDAGTYNATITISDTNASNDPLLVSVELTVYPTQLTQINCVSPANESILSSPPTFTWSAYGGTNNIFAVDLSLSYPIAGYWSTYENLGLQITDSGWTPSASQWDAIPSGSFVYWRVRGANLAYSPLTIIMSDEVWWFYKQ
jgi:subtilisin-like proprotein convertase family protein